ncbi:hypothetical protein HZS55_08475 [Halosimplex rubrum]|uniref:Uncharacterized protein n=1 Tax=Halosimplex rubrum TaxID=869889 RepID=A0A7D5P3K4_9EURY|nr:hypothetical protein [Halosimplex rubrum]QLH77324.1 hypothetical protein HZS55_08475 [Halosimplex rubrum]
MGSDGLVELDRETRVVPAKYNLLLATLFGVLALVLRTILEGDPPMLVETGALAVLFGAVQASARLSA